MVPCRPNVRQFLVDHYPARAPSRCASHNLRERLLPTDSSPPAIEDVQVFPSCGIALTLYRFDRRLEQRRAAVAEHLSQRWILSDLLGIGSHPPEPSVLWPVPDVPNAR